MHSARFVLRTVAAVVLVWSHTHFAAAKPTQLAVTSHDEQLTVRHSVLLLQGTVAAEAGSLKIINLSAPEDAEAVQVVRHRDKFRALVELFPGKNELSLVADEPEQRSRFVINYQPQTNPYYVRLVWMTDNSGATEFATPTVDTPQDYEARLRTAALLMQSFTAERMNQQGYGYRTFRLERDQAGEVVVHTWRGPQSKDEYHAMQSDQLWWRHVYGWINSEHPDAFAKNMVLAAYTRKEPGTGKMLAHTALGGGNLGLFGSASVFSWPRSIAEASAVFQNDSLYDTTLVHDDSVGRSTVWGLASTTIGATLHEMGHTFGLPHVIDPRGIMRRGFDQFNRAFTFYDPPSGRNAGPVYFAGDEEAYFAPISASYLRWSRWFQLDEQEFSDNRPKIAVDEDDGKITVTSDNGVAWIGLHSGDEVRAFTEYDPNNLPREVTLPRKQIDEDLEGQPLNRIRAIGPGGLEASQGVETP